MSLTKSFENDSETASVIAKSEKRKEVSGRAHVLYVRLKKNLLFRFRTRNSLFYLAFFLQFNKKREKVVCVP